MLLWQYHYYHCDAIFSGVGGNLRWKEMPKQTHSHFSWSEFFLAKAEGQKLELAQENQVVADLRSLPASSSLYSCWLVQWVYIDGHWWVPPLFAAWWLVQVLSLGWRTVEWK